MKKPAVACIIPNREEEQCYVGRGLHNQQTFLSGVWCVVLTDLSVGYTNKPFIDQFVCFGVSGLSLHDVALSCFISQGDGGNLDDNKYVKMPIKYK